MANLLRLDRHGPMKIMCRCLLTKHALKQQEFCRGKLVWRQRESKGRHAGRHAGEWKVWIDGPSCETGTNRQPVNDARVLCAWPAMAKGYAGCHEIPGHGAIRALGAVVSLPGKFGKPRVL